MPPVNNELGPELFMQLELLRDLTLPSNITVIIQLSQASDSLTTLLGINIATNRWSGVRRYVFTYNRLEQVYELGVTIMADPNKLREFITWGINQYPSDRVMLILSGHSAGLLGSMMENNFIKHSLSIMSIPGMCQAISAGVADGRIDILVLDTCLMNMIEIWYEFALAPGHPVSYLLVPQKQLIGEGLPWKLVIDLIVEATIRKIPIEQIPRRISLVVLQKTNMIGPILVVDLAVDSLIAIKDSISQIAAFAVEEHIRFRDKLLEWEVVSLNDQIVNVIRLERILNTRLSNSYFLPSTIEKMLSEIIFCPSLDSSISNLEGPAIFFPKALIVNNELEYYKSLKFCCDNDWVKLLEKHLFDHE
jgi:hypothetical protein